MSVKLPDIRRSLHKMQDAIMFDTLKGGKKNNGLV